MGARASGSLVLVPFAPPQTTLSVATERVVAVNAPRAPALAAEMLASGDPFVLNGVVRSRHIRDGARCASPNPAPRPSGSPPVHAPDRPRRLEGRRLALSIAANRRVRTLALRAIQPHLART
jgi:hypothetical protein